MVPGDRLLWTLVGCCFPRSHTASSVLPFSLSEARRLFTARQRLAVATRRAHVEVAAERGGPAALDGAQDRVLLRSQDMLLPVRDRRRGGREDAKILDLVFPSSRLPVNPIGASEGTRLGGALGGLRAARRDLTVGAGLNVRIRDVAFSDEVPQGCGAKGTGHGRSMRLAGDRHLGAVRD